MPDRTTILTSRRAYEFGPDELRLTVLSAPEIQNQLRDLCGFQLAGVGTPQPTFGAVPETLPPGLVFNIGTVRDDSGQIYPVRFLHVEPRRIVFDVAAPTAIIPVLFDRIQEQMAGCRAPDGRPVIGQPRRILDYSEITSVFDFDLEDMFPAGVRSLFQETLTGDADGAVVPAVTLEAHGRGAEYAGIPNQPDSRTLRFGLRQGSRPTDRLYFSAAPLDSDSHLDYLSRLEQTVTGQT